MNFLYLLLIERMKILKKNKLSYKMQFQYNAFCNK